MITFLHEYTKTRSIIGAKEMYSILLTASFAVPIAKKREADFVRIRMIDYFSQVDSTFNT